MTGSGTPEDPYIIYDVNDLQAMENNLAAHYELANDIDASATTEWNGGLGFAPIGYYYDTKFTGSFDGKGYVISGLFINRPANDEIALFGCTGNGCGPIRNVGIEDCDITGRTEVAALIAFQDDVGSETSNCYSTGSITGARSDYNTYLNYVAGLIGYASAAVTNCYSTCTITATHTGTGVGARGSVTECGGLIGALYGQGDISNCYATGDITATSENKDVDAIGGLVGQLDGYARNVTSSYSTGDVSATAGRSTSYIGGFIGSWFLGTMSDCFSRGNITVSAVSLIYGRIGGFCGYVQSAVVDNCYSTGLLTVTEGMVRVGGFCGSNYGTITDSFWDTETSGIETSDGGTGKTTAEMKTKATFRDAGWDFATIWNICSGINGDYPCLIGITPSCILPVVAPTVTTNPATELGAIAAILNGTLDDDGGEVCECGFEFGLDTGYGTITPTESKITDEDFSQVIGGLTPNTTYHFRAFATNSVGTSYGADETFTTALIISRAFALAREEL